RPGARSNNPIEERVVLGLRHGRIRSKRRGRIRRARNGLVRDYEIELRDDGDELADGADAGERSLVRTTVPRTVEDPPEVAVPHAVAANRRRVELRYRRDDAGRFGHPSAR